MLPRAEDPYRCCSWASLVSGVTGAERPVASCHGLALESEARSMAGLAAEGFSTGESGRFRVLPASQAAHITAHYSRPGLLRLMPPPGGCAVDGNHQNNGARGPAA